MGGGGDDQIVAVTYEELIHQRVGTVRGVIAL